MSRMTIGKYIDLKPIGKGGMAEVYIGVDPTLNRQVAIKLILPHFAEKDDFEARFQREAETVAGLRHPNIVQIYEYSIEADGTPFMVMEYLDGGTLDDKLAEYEAKGTTMPLTEVAAILGKVGSGLDYAHERGLVHRDIKPANILFSEDDEPIIADFGIVKLLNDTAMLTQTGGLVGSPRYLPPEQASQKEIDKRSDIYSLGIVVYQMVTGEVPFDGDIITVMMQHVNEPPQNPVTINAELPEGTADVILKALEKDPAYRYDSAGEMAAAFRNSLSNPTPIVNTVATAAGQTISTPPKEPEIQPEKSLVKPIIGGIVGLLLLAIIGFILFGDGLGRTPEETPSPVATEVVREVVPTEMDTPVVLDTPVAPENEEENGIDATVTETAVIQQPEQTATVPPSEPTPIPVDTTIPHGDIVFGESTVTVTLNDLMPLEEGFVYAAWLTEEESAPLFLGLVEPSGTNISFTDPEDSDILLNFSGFALTEEPKADADPTFKGRIVYEARVDEHIIQDYRHLKEITDITIDEALRDKMMIQATAFSNHVGFSLADILNNGTLEGGKNHAEHAINIAAGTGSEDYFDWDHDGRPENPGDDVGLLPYVRLFANAATTADLDDEIINEMADLLDQIAERASLLMKITASDTLDEAAVHAEELDAEQGQILEKVGLLLEATQSADFGTRFEVFATGN